MWLAYVIAAVPLLIGAVLFVVSEKVTWWEWLSCAAAGLVVSVVFHVVSVASMTADVETWSGRVTEVVHYPRWVEEYEEVHTRTVGSGKNQRTETYTTTEHRTHEEHWERHDDFGEVDRDERIDRGEYEDIARQFGGQVDVETPHKSGFDEGDPNVYHVRNRTGVIIPLTMSRRFENRIKAAPSVFSFAKVPAGVEVLDWPGNPDPRVSDRVMGIARNRFTTLKWDQMCSRLGPTARVNLIVVGFASDDSSLGEWQRAKWVGGKKNDLVLCYGAADRGPRARWALVFGWTEREDVKKNLQTMLLENELNDDLLPRIEAEVSEHYRLKDWSKFDYITVEPPWWSFLVLVGVMVAVQGGAWAFAFLNDADKFKKRFSRLSAGNRLFRRGMWS